MSKNSKANRRRRGVKDARHAKRRRSSSGGASWPSVSGLFEEDQRLTVSVIRSASGRQYAEETTIPFPDREVVAVIENVAPSEAERVAKELEAKIKAGGYPVDSRVSVMGGWSSSFTD